MQYAMPPQNVYGDEYGMCPDQPQVVIRTYTFGAPPPPCDYTDYVGMEQGTVPPNFTHEQQYSHGAVDINHHHHHHHDVQQHVHHMQHHQHDQTGQEQVSSNQEQPNEQHQHHHHHHHHAHHHDAHFQANVGDQQPMVSDDEPAWRQGYNASGAGADFEAGPQTSYADCAIPPPPPSEQPTPQDDATPNLPLVVTGPQPTKEGGNIVVVQQAPQPQQFVVGIVHPGCGVTAWLPCPPGCTPLELAAHITRLWNMQRPGRPEMMLTRVAPLQDTSPLENQVLPWDMLHAVYPEKPSSEKKQRQRNRGGSKAQRTAQYLGIVHSCGEAGWVSYYHGHTTVTALKADVARRWGVKEDTFTLARCTPLQEDCAIDMQCAHLEVLHAVYPTQLSVPIPNSDGTTCMGGASTGMMGPDPDSALAAAMAAAPRPPQQPQLHREEGSHHPLQVTRILVTAGGLSPTGSTGGSPPPTPAQQQPQKPQPVSTASSAFPSSPLQPTTPVLSTGSSSSATSGRNSPGKLGKGAALLLQLRTERALQSTSFARWRLWLQFCYRKKQQQSKEESQEGKAASRSSSELSHQNSSASADSSVGCEPSPALRRAHAQRVKVSELQAASCGRMLTGRFFAKWRRYCGAKAWHCR